MDRKEQYKMWLDYFTEIKDEAIAYWVSGDNPVTGEPEELPKVAKQALRQSQRTRVWREKNAEAST